MADGPEVKQVAAHGDVGAAITVTIDYPVAPLNRRDWKVVDLMAALTQSVQKARESPGEGAADVHELKPKKTAAKKVPAKKTTKKKTASKKTTAKKPRRSA